MNVVSEIVKHGFCVGCGICVALCPRENLKIIWNELGEYQPIDTGRCLEKCDVCLNICPRFYRNENQYEIAKEQFAAIPDICYDNAAGYFVGCFAGYAKDEKLRNQAASGGLCTVFLKSLLDSNKIDGVICVRSSNDPKKLFELFIASSYVQLYMAAGSVYHPVEMSTVIREILEQDEARYAIVGLPCFLTAISLAQKKFRKLGRIIKYKIGLVCGSLPNGTFNEKILTQIGESADSIQSIKFRDTSIYPNRLRGMKLTDLQGKEHFAFNAHEARIRRSGRFIYTACMLCSDIFAETADAVFMDAWLPEYRNDQFGTSFVQIRNRELMEIVNEIKKNHLAHLNEIEIDKIIASQQIRINNKRQGLWYRIKLCEKWGVPYPGNIHLELHDKQLNDNQKKKIALKFAEHLRTHGIQVKNRFFLFKLLSLASEIKADIKETVRKYYFYRKYFKKR